LFVALYAGTIGLVSGADVVVRAAAQLAQRSDILLLVVGEGAAKRAAMREARERGLSNLKFIDFQPRSRLNEMQAAANVGLVTLAPGRARTSVPSKVLGYMAAGRPIVASVDLDSDTAREIADHDTGLVVPPGDATALAAALGALADDPKRTTRLGIAARQRFDDQFTARKNLDQYTRLFTDLIAGAGDDVVQ
jgi:colanic acid biosynthesis glycosyl transferase WcaI